MTIHRETFLFLLILPIYKPLSFMTAMLEIIEELKYDFSHTFKNPYENHFEVKINQKHLPS